MRVRKRIMDIIESSLAITGKGIKNMEVKTILLISSS
jgi:hypothetical protein